jgi:UTP--glucose-1-phosphate uridylyltransferase
MLPVGDKPVIQRVVEEAIAAGITKIILLAAISNHAVGHQAEAPCRREDTIAPVSKAVAVARDRNCRLGGKAIGDDDVGRP